MSISKPASKAVISALAFQMFVLVFATQVFSISSAAQDTFTSPIDITGMKLQVHVFAPDRENGNLVEVPIPVGFLTPKLSQLLDTPLSSQFDKTWNTPDANGETPKTKACNDMKPIVERRISSKEIPVLGSISAYDITCNFQSTGKLLVKQYGATLILAYQLIGNKVSMSIATHATCHAGHGTPGCPIDPHFTATFVMETDMSLRIADLCHITSDPASVLTKSANLEGSDNFTGAIAEAADDLFSGSQNFMAAEQGMEGVQKIIPSPLVDSFSEMIAGPGCKNRDPLQSTLLSAFGNVAVLIQPPQGIILRVTHRGIQPPLMDATLSLPAQQIFTHPTISITKPTVVPGSTVAINGIYFPANNSYVNTLPIRFVHYGYAGASTLHIGKGPCFDGATELQITPVNGQPHIERLPADTNGICVVHDDAKNLVPGTTYQFRARDCDPITCSPWTASQKASTDPATANKGSVSFTIDGGNTGGCGKFKGTSCKSAAGAQIGSATVNSQGTFVANVTIPASVSPGSHTIRAFNGDATAELPVMVAAASGPSGQASLMMIGLFPGETGCPNHPINSFQTGAAFTLFGKGFSAGAIAIHLDAANAPFLGTVTAAADGTFCQKISAPPANQVGAHKLVAVQNGVVRAQLQVTFVSPEIIH